MIAEAPTIVSFQKLHKRHHELMALRRKELVPGSVTTEARDFIFDLLRAALQHGDKAEREMLAYYAEYWRDYVYDITGDDPNRDLTPEKFNTLQPLLSTGSEPREEPLHSHKPAVFVTPFPIETPASQSASAEALHTETLLAGRQTQMKAVLQQLQPGSLVGVHGQVGIGKTHLARALAHHPRVWQRFPDGVLWASLAQRSVHLGEEQDSDGLHRETYLHDQSAGYMEILGAWGRALSVPEAQLSSHTSLTERRQCLRSVLSAKRMLLVLDEVETREAAGHFACHGPLCAVLLLTTRQQLGQEIPEASSLRLPELDHDDSARLLKQSLDRKLTPHEHAGIAHYAAGSPLALVMAARCLSCFHRIHPQDIIAALRKAELRPGLEAEVFRQRLRALLDGLAHLFPAEVLQTLQALAVFPVTPNRFSRHAAEAVLGSDAPETEARLQPLLRLGVLKSGAAQSYALHWCVAVFCPQAQCVENPVYLRFARFYLGALGELSRQALASFLQAQRGNICVALQVVARYCRALSHVDTSPDGLGSLFLRAINACYDELETHGRYHWIQDLLLAAQRVDAADSLPLETARLHLNMGRLYEKQGFYFEAKDVLHQALRYIEARVGAEYDAARAAALYHIGVVADNLGNYPQAERALECSLSWAESTSNFDLLSRIYDRFSVVSTNQGYYVQALRYDRRGQEFAARLDDPERKASHLLNISVVCVHQGRYDEAEANAREGLRLVYVRNSKEKLAALWHTRGQAARWRREYSCAAEYLTEALRLAKEIEHIWYVSLAWIEWGELYLAQNMLEKAAQAFDEGHRIAPVYSRNLQAFARFGQARVAGCNEDYALARRLGEESYTLLSAIKHGMRQETRKWLDALPLPTLQQCVAPAW